jgi:hypothetical protein
MAVSLLMCTFKPQIALFPIVYLLFSGHAKLILRSAWLSIAVGAGTVIALPWHGLAGDFVDSIRGYQAFSSNRPPHVTGIASLLTPTFGLISNSMTWTLIGILAVVVSARWIVRTRRPVLGSGAITLTFAMTGALIQLHPYDDALYITVIALAAGLRQRAEVIPWLIALALVARAPNFLSLVQQFGAPATWSPAMMCSVSAIPLLLLAYWRVYRLKGREL